MTRRLERVSLIDHESGVKKLKIHVTDEAYGN